MFFFLYVFAAAIDRFGCYRFYSIRQSLLQMRRIFISKQFMWFRSSLFISNKDFFLREYETRSDHRSAHNDKIRLNNNETEVRQILANEWKLWGHRATWELKMTIQKNLFDRGKKMTNFFCGRWFDIHSYVNYAKHSLQPSFIVVHSIAMNGT